MGEKKNVTQETAKVELKGDAKGAAEEKPDEDSKPPKQQVGATKAQVTVAQTEDTVFFY